MGNAENPSEFNAPSTGQASRKEILEALERIKSDGSFAGANRLVDLLDYIVTQHLADPERKILAKIIAEDIYDRALDQDTDSHNIVRVDAGRLRRRLAAYYAGPGEKDPIVIHVDPGAYAPRFEVRKPVAAPSEPAAHIIESKGRGLGAAGLLGGVLAALCLGFILGKITSPSAPADPFNSEISQGSGDPKLEAERRARLAKSPFSLQAVTLSDTARYLIFPMFERRQLELSLAMFRQAIQKDDTYFGGYAGASQCLSAMAVLMPDGAKRNELLSEARRMVDHAIKLSPTNSWTQSALSWTSYAEGQIALAKEHSEIALDLAPNDGNILDFHAMLMLLAGEFEAARAAADPDRKRTSGQGRLANRSFYGAASFHLGLYEEAIASLNAATVSGDPISAPNFAYLAASYQGLGETGKARQFALELMENWPGFDPSVVFGWIYINPDQVNAVVTKLTEAGWVKSAERSPVQSSAK